MSFVSERLAVNNEVLKTQFLLLKLVYLYGETSKGAVSGVLQKSIAHFFFGGGASRRLFCGQHGGTTGALAQHEQAGTLCHFLTTINDNGDMYMPFYSWPRDLDDTPSLNVKIFYSVLDFACLDTDGPRGEEKIHMIIEAAKRMNIPMSQLFTVQQVYVGHVEPGGWRVFGGNHVPPSRDALCTLIDN